MTHPVAATANTQETLRVQAAEQLRLLAARTDPKSPGTPPWAWVNLTADQAEWLDSALDEFVDTYNRIHAGTVEDVIPACWRLHPPLAQEMPVAFWAWWAAHIDPKATVGTALEYYSRHLPGFQTRLRERLLGKGAVFCRKGSHSRPAADVARFARRLIHATASRRGSRPRPGRADRPPGGRQAPRRRAPGPSPRPAGSASRRACRTGRSQRSGIGPGEFHC